MFNSRSELIDDAELVLTMYAATPAEESNESGGV